jgi:RNA polymerase sigma factor (sigma-70 family)
MATGPGDRILRHVREAVLARHGAGLSDGQLLGCFVEGRDEAAFTALVRRHGPMVLGVCRRLLWHAQDAEDAFQVVFLVLARKAAALRARELVGNWLYGVAYRTALRARAALARRRAREKQVGQLPHPLVEPAEAQDWRPVLDGELSRLPEKYRAAVVLCDLQGRPRREAARQLGLPDGTLSRRLAAGRRLLAERLAHRGVALSGGALAVLLSQDAASAQVAAPLTAATVRAAALVAAGRLAAVATPVALLTKGVLRAMFFAKLKVTVGAVLLLAALGAGGLALRPEGVASAQQEKRADGKPRNELEALRRQNELLKLNLEVVLEKVRAQEAELRSLRAKVASAAHLDFDSSTSLRLPRAEASLLGRLEGLNRPEPDAGRQAEAALKTLREAKDDAARRRAVEALDRALQGLRQQLRKPTDDSGAKRP